MHKFSDDARLTLEVGGAKMEANYNASKDEWEVKTTLPSGRFRGARVWNGAVGEELQSLANRVGEYIFTHRDCFPEYSGGGDEYDDERLRVFCKIFGTRYLQPATCQPVSVPLLIMDGDKYIKRMENFEEAKEYAQNNWGYKVFQEAEVEGGG